MKRISTAGGFFALFLLAAALAPAPTLESHPSLVSKVLATYAPSGASPGDANTGAMAEAAKRFLQALDKERRAEGALALNDPERSRWTNTPPRGSEGGVRLGDCTERELHAACDLLAAVLSPQGYGRVRDILLGDDRLLRDGQPRPGFGAENFWLAIFGEPSATERWALQLDGHHLAVNMTFEGESVGLSPTFLGAQPAQFPRAQGQPPAEPLDAEAALAYALLTSLSDEQRAQAVVAGTRGPNVAAAGKDGFVPEREGLACSELDAAQRAQLEALLERSCALLPGAHAQARARLLIAEIDAMHFAWRGPVEHPADISYRVQSPSLILEFACQDLGGDPLQHLHCMLRNPQAEYLPAAAAR